MKIVNLLILLRKCVILENIPVLPDQFALEGTVRDLQKIFDKDITFATWWPENQAYILTGKNKISLFHPEKDRPIKSFDILPSNEEIQNCKDFDFRHNCTESEIYAAVPINRTSIIVASKHAGSLQTMVSFPQI